MKVYHLTAQDYDIQTLDIYLEGEVNPKNYWEEYIALLKTLRPIEFVNYHRIAEAKIHEEICTLLGIKPFEYLGNVEHYFPAWLIAHKGFKYFETEDADLLHLRFDYPMWKETE